jgi:hypothetical protein
LELDSSASIVTRLWGVRILFPAGTEIFLFSIMSRCGLGPPSFLANGNWGPLLDGETRGVWSWPFAPNLC